MRSHNSPGGLSGRLLLTLVLVGTSAGAFTLGYFVGRHSIGFSEKDIIEVRPEPEAPAPPHAQTRQPGALSESPAGRQTPATPTAVDSQATKVEEPAGAAETKPLEKPASSPSSEKPRALFAVQAGAFQQMKAAQALRSNLSKKGYNSYIETIRSGNSTIFKVKVGRFGTREEAENVLSRMKKIRGLKPFLVSIG